MHNEDKCEFLVKLLKDELATQSNVFDQIDNKTGVALGFTFVAVGQLLSSALKTAPTQNPAGEGHPRLLIAICISVGFAIVFGAIARWPRSFEYAINWQDEDLKLECVE